MVMENGEENKNKREKQKTVERNAAGTYLPTLPTDGYVLNADTLFI
jgi:hypothetical protein